MTEEAMAREAALDRGYAPSKADGRRLGGWPATCWGAAASGLSFRTAVGGLLS
jgi:hypothetical protein